MKFLCDRCKTRYSIGDERVRGKILKIRCKNCANVITVREGMTADPEASPAVDPAGRAKKATTASPAPLTDERELPPSEQARGDRPRAVVSPAESLRGAGVAAREAKAPVAARDPAVAAKAPASRAGSPGLSGQPKKSPPSDDVRGARGGAKRAAPEASSEPGHELGAAFASAMDRPPPALEEEWYVSIDGDQSGPFSLAEAQHWVAQKPFDAELHCWSEGFDDWLPVDKVSHFRGLRKRPLAAPVPPLPRAAGVAARAAPSSSSAPVRADEPKPLLAAGIAQLDRAGASSSGAGILSSSTPARATPPFGTAIAARSNGAPLRGSVGGPFDTSENSELGAELGSTRFRDPTEPWRTTQPAAGTPAPATSALLAGGASGASLIGAIVSAPASDFESDAHGDDLHIGEVSRVVNLADIARVAPRPAAPGGPAIRAPGVRAITNAGVPLQAGAAPPLLSELDPGAVPIAKAHRRGLIVLLGVAAVMMLGVTAAVVFLVATGDELTGGALGTVRNIDTSRPEDPITHRPVDTGSAEDKPVAPTPVPRPIVAVRPSPGTSRDPEPLPGNSLRSDEIEDIARKHQDSTQRCYMRSQRGADSILVGDVKKIAVTLTIDKDGNVTDLQLSEHGEDNLGKCLTGSMKSWKFRQSSGGTFRFSLNFVSG